MIPKQGLLVEEYGDLDVGSFGAVSTLRLTASYDSRCNHLAELQEMFEGTAAAQEGS